MFPDAPLYTLIHIPNSTSKIIENRKITTSFLNKIPGIENNYRKFLPIFPVAAQSLKIVEDAELILSSSHCVIKGVKKNKNAKHLSYVHSPMRYIYDQFDSYFGKPNPLYIRAAATAVRPYLRFWDRSSNSNVDQMIANSQFVKERIQKYYKINSKVIHPFVDLDDFKKIQDRPPAKEDFYLMVSAFAPNKRVDLAIEAFNNLGLKLIIIGSGQQDSILRQQAKSNITFMGNMSREDVIDHMARAKAFIFPGVEDFGITPLESLASSTPVIAYKTGGVLETLNDKTACFFTEDNSKSLMKAISEFEKKEFIKKDLTDRAREFSKQKFKENITNEIDLLMNK